MPEHSDDRSTDEEQQSSGWEFEPGEVAREQTPPPSPVPGEDRREPREQFIEKRLVSHPPDDDGERFYWVRDGRSGNQTLVSAVALEGRFKSVTVSDSDHFEIEEVARRSDSPGITGGENDV